MEVVLVTLHVYFAETEEEGAADIPPAASLD